MDPVTALRQIAFYKDRAREESRRVMAYRNAADTIEALDEAQREKHGKANSWQTLSGLTVVEALRELLAGLEEEGCSGRVVHRGGAHRHSLQHHSCRTGPRSRR